MIKSIILGLTCLFATASFAATPTFTLTPTTPTNITISPAEKAVVSYRVTNNTPFRLTNNGVLQLPRGVKPIPAPGGCSNPFTLAPHGSCLLQLEIDGDKLKDSVHNGPVVCHNLAHPIYCAQPSLKNKLSIRKLNKIKTYRISGTITGLSSTGLVLKNNGGNNLSIPAGATSFKFSKKIPQGGHYNVTVAHQPNGQICTVNNGDGIDVSQNINNVRVICSDITYTIGGSISGLNGQVTLQNNGADNLTRNTDGSFTFATPVAQGAGYNVTVLNQPAGQICTVDNGTGVNVHNNITNISVICSDITYTIGGIISGLNGQVILQNNGGDNLPLNADGSFTFNTPVAQGADYNVTILNQPAEQICEVNNGSGSNVQNNITSVTVTCHAHRIYTANDFSSGANVVSACDVDATTGLLSNCQNSGTGLENPYGLAFNPAGTMLYITNSGSSNDWISSCSLDVNGNLTGCTIAGDGFSGPQGVAFKPDSTMLYVANSGDQSVYRCNVASNGDLTGCISAGGGFSGPKGLTFNLSGTVLYVANTGNSTVSRCSLDGNGDLTCANAGGSGFSQPDGLTFNPSGTQLYVVNNGNNTVIRCSLDVNGNLTVCSNAGIDEVFNIPSSIAFNTDGTRAYISDVLNNSIRVCDVEGSGNLINCVSSGTDITRPAGIAYR